MLVAAHSQRDRRKLERENPCSSLGRMAESWDTEFESPIPLPSGAELVSLRDAIEYIRCLPESAREHEFWQMAIKDIARAVETPACRVIARRAVVRAIKASG